MIWASLAPNSTMWDFPWEYSIFSVLNTQMSNGYSVFEAKASFVNPIILDLSSSFQYQFSYATRQFTNASSGKPALILNLRFCDWISRFPYSRVNVADSVLGTNMITTSVHLGPDPTFPSVTDRHFTDLKRSWIWPVMNDSPLVKYH